MSVLIRVIDCQGHHHVCDQRCYDSQDELRPCICLRANRGIGFLEAQQQTEQLARYWLRQWLANHPLLKLQRVRILDQWINFDQRDLFPWPETPSKNTSAS